MPYSVFTGRPTPAPGEPLFTPEDTAAAIALAEEERDTCPSCGLPKAWCRDSTNQFSVFETHEEQCHATYAMAVHRAKVTDRSDETKAATQLSVLFAAGRVPDFDAGLGLADSADRQNAPNDQAENEQGH